MQLLVMQLLPVTKKRPGKDTRYITQYGPIRDDVCVTHLTLDSSTFLERRRNRNISGKELDNRHVADLHPLHPIVHTRAQVALNPVREIGKNSKTTVVVLMKALGPFLSNRCADTKFLVQFPSKTLFGSLSVLDLTPWELPEPSKFFIGRAASEQDRIIPSNDCSRDNSFVIHHSIISEMDQ